MRIGLIVTAICLCLVVPNAKAQVTDFRIDTFRNTWCLSKYGSSINDTNKYSGVNWKYTSSPTAHRMWFRVLNSQEVAKATVLVNGLGIEVFETNLASDESAYLLGRRENASDVETTVTGTWTA